MNVTVILLAGGRGERMGTALPKQFLPIHEQPIALYSFEQLALRPEVGELIVVCEDEYRALFIEKNKGFNKDLTFAPPGFRRQDSVYNAFRLLRGDVDLVCIHDSARPCITQDVLGHLFAQAAQCGAAVVAVRANNTLKIIDEEGFVQQTLERGQIWEVQTPQVIAPELLKRGFAMAKQEGIDVTDDVSLVELLGEPVKIVEGSYKNIKVTHIEDLPVVKIYLEIPSICLN